MNFIRDYEEDQPIYNGDFSNSSQLEYRPCP